MEKTLILAALFLFAALPLFAFILPEDRSIDWSNCGVPGGISETPQVFDLKNDFNAKGDGVTDDSVPLKKAILTVAGPGAIFIPEGTYLIKSPVVINKNNVVLRGAGAKRTKLVFDLNGLNTDAIAITRDEGGKFVKIKAGSARGSREIIVENPGELIKGSFAEIVQDNDPKAMYTRPLWNQSWAQAAAGQVLKVIDIQGDRVLLDEPLHMAFSAGLNARIRSLGMNQRCGIENLYLERADNGDGNIITMKNAAYCAVKGVESAYAMRSHVAIEASYKCEVRESLFHHAHDYGGGGHGYGVELKQRASNCLVEDNTFYNLRHSMMAHVGANGNVFGYNYSTRTVATGDNDPSKIICDVSVHGHYPFMNLFESNKVQKVEVSDWWGPAGPGNTFLRNVIEGEGIIINDRSNYQNLLGNRVVKGNFGIEVAGSVDASTIISRGNYSYGAAVEKAGDIPVSLYLKSKPSFLGNMPWPLFGPGAGAVLPAEKRFEQGLKHEKKGKK